MIDFILDSIRGNMIKSDRNLEIIDKRRDSMISKSQVVVRYAETDQMGIVHHSNYPVWYEIGRTDLIKETGITYSELERMGVMTPLVELSCRYIGVARYEDVLTVETSIAELTPSRIRLPTASSSRARTSRSIPAPPSTLGSTPKRSVP